MQSEGFGTRFQEFDLWFVCEFRAQAHTLQAKKICAGQLVVPTPRSLEETRTRTFRPAGSRQQPHYPCFLLHPGSPLFLSTMYT